MMTSYLLSELVFGECSTLLATHGHGVGVGGLWGGLCGTSKHVGFISQHVDFIKEVLVLTLHFLNEEAKLDVLFLVLKIERMDILNFLKA